MLIEDFTKQFSYRFRKNGRFRRAFGVGCVAVAIIIYFVIVLVFWGKGEESTTKNVIQTGQSVEDISTGQDEEFTYTVPANAPLEEDRYPDVNNLVTEYLTAIASGDTATVSKLKRTVCEEDLVKTKVESQYIDSFNNIKVYTLPGPIEGTYLAMVYYDLVFYDVPNSPAPGMSTLYVVTGPEGLQISNDDEIDSKTETYITEITQQNDVIQLMDSVKEKYQVALSGSCSLKAFMEIYPDVVEKKVSEAIADEQGDGGTTGEDKRSQTICTAVETVNVRSSDSEDAEKIGKLQTGEHVIRLKSQENGWSIVSFNGSEAYVKSEYLKEAEDQKKTAIPDEKSAENTGIAIETVNLRESASQDAKKIGVVYRNEPFKIIEDQGEWTLIEYSVKTGFVKSEFIK